MKKSILSIMFCAMGLVALAQTNFRHISFDEAIAAAKQENKLVFIDFYTDWCGPCKMIAPFYVELSEKYPSLMFIVIDVEELTEFSTSWDIKATPTFFFLRDGQQIDKLVGANKPELQKKITAIIDSTSQYPK